MGLPLRPGVQCHVAAEHGGGPVARVVVAERSDTGPFLPDRLRARGRFPAIHVVLAAYGEPDAMARRHDDTGWPHLDVDFVDFARCELLDLIVGVIGPVRQRELLVELAMRDA